MLSTNSSIELTNLKPIVTESEIIELVEEALMKKYKAVCIPPYWVKKVRREIPSSEELQLVTTAGFPFGFSRSEPKLLEIKKALEEGADEIDVMMNLTAFKSDVKGWAKIEVAQFANIIHEHQKLFKLIIEMPYLNDEEVETACQIAKAGGVDFISVTSGFATRPATVFDTMKLKKLLGSAVEIKTQVDSTLDVEEAVQHGANRVAVVWGKE
ncbi:deoxyribose-phosphate aldolase [Sediminitomix flava]|uniref:Deoxyribose-phosphate aldolase n=1 Tax=Sediminitomix flava TaxID=379075 RepID=A0A315Z721_SEDFL|nr:deoxyribose-phosphate aldolase [Sediminitomix flava]PWJ40207.1 deoxyribose-phosphate aldolase [Sediminitomix flava]